LIELLRIAGIPAKPFPIPRSARRCGKMALDDMEPTPCNLRASFYQLTAHGKATMILSETPIGDIHRLLLNGGMWRGDILDKLASTTSHKPDAISKALCSMYDLGYVTRGAAEEV
jgi:hypothetical protein